MKIKSGYAVLFLLFVTLGIYYPTIFAGANTVDDPQMITGYLSAEHFNLKGLFLSGGSGYYYRPLLGLTLVFDNIVWGMHESFMHLENVIFHAVNVILVFLITTKVARRYSIADSYLPLCAALLFAIHPINTESVNWISGRTDLLAGNFILASILLLLTAAQTGCLLFCAAAAVSFLVSCFAKEVAVFALPGLLFIFLFHDQYGSFLERLRKKWGGCLFLSLSALTYFLFRFIALKGGDTGIKTATAIVSTPAVNFLNTIRIILKVFGFYLKKIFIPWPLNFAIVKVSDYYVILGVILIFVIIYLLYKKSLISALFLTSVCVIAPALLVALGRMAWTPFAERYLYIPCATFSIAISLVVYRYLQIAGLKYRKSFSLTITLLFAFCVFSTASRNVVWQSNISLLQDTLRNSPDFFLAQNALAGALQEQGRVAEARQLLMSIEAPAGSKRGGKLVDSNRAGIMAANGDLAGAKRLLLRNIEDSGVMFPSIVEQIISIDVRLFNKEHNVTIKQELRQEIEQFLLKLKERSGDPFYYYRIGQFHLNTGDKAAAQRNFSEAARLSPEGTHYKLAAKKLAEKLK